MSDPRFAPIVLEPGTPAWLVVYEAMAQYTENHSEYLDLADGQGRNLAPTHTIEGETAKQATAEALLEKFDAACAAVADHAERSPS